MESSDFDWNQTDLVIVQRVSGIAIYQNDDGEIVIRQEKQMGDDFDHAIIFAPQYLKQVIAALRNLSKVAK